MGKRLPDPPEPLLAKYQFSPIWAVFWRKRAGYKSRASAVSEMKLRGYPVTCGKLWRAEKGHRKVSMVTFFAMVDVYRLSDYTKLCTVRERPANWQLHKKILKIKMKPEKKLQRLTRERARIGKEYSWRTKGGAHHEANKDSSKPS